MVLAAPEPALAAMANLKILYQLGGVLGGSFDVEQVLEVVMDLVFEHVKADRGIILLIDANNNNALVSKVVRTRDEETRGGDSKNGAAADNQPKIQASRTIINYVINHGEGVLSSNAMADQRFS